MESAKKSINNSKWYMFLLLLWKKLRDSKLRTKLYIYILLITILFSIIIGGASYWAMKDALIEIVQESAVNSIKQAGSRLEDKIREFQSASYSLVSSDGIVAILAENERDVSQWNYISNGKVFNNNIVFYDILYKNSDYAMMEANNEQIYIYNRPENENKMNTDLAQGVFDRLREEVNIASPVKWMKTDGQIYFVRQIVRAGKNQKMEEAGLLVLAVKEEFYNCGDDTDDFVNNGNLIVADPPGQIFKNQELGLESEDLKTYLNYNEGRYYVYAVSDRIDREQYLIVPLRTEKYQWNILCFIPYDTILEEVDQVILWIIAVTIFLLIIGLISTNIFHKLYRRNLDIIEAGIRQYEVGYYSRLDSPACYDELGMLILQFNHMGVKINELNELTRREQEEKQNLRYQVMETQINPHFLYNTLGTVKWLAFEKEQDEIVKLTDAIIGLLRFTIKNANKNIKLRDEIAYLKNYIYIQQMKYDNAFLTEFLITEEAMEFSIIGFILQPFVENSILHGLDISKTDGVIRISGEIVEEKLKLKIEDNGIGMPQEKLAELLHRVETDKLEQYKGFNGIGVTNTLLRLKMTYGERFQYTIKSEAGMGTSVTMLIPKGENSDENTSPDSRR